MFHQFIKYIKLFQFPELQTSSINLEKYGMTCQRLEIEFLI